MAVIEEMVLQSRRYWDY